MSDPLAAPNATSHILRVTLAMTLALILIL